MAYKQDNRLVEKCPDCGEEFVLHQGGAQCQETTCEQKRLENKHREVAQPMTNYLISEYNATVKFPNTPITSETNEWGWSNVVSRTIHIPWYTLRSKKEFFDTIVHESAHISAYEHKFNRQTKKVMKEYNRLENNYLNDPSSFNDSQLNNFIRKHYKELENFAKEAEKSEGQHWGNPWYLQYRRFFKRLLNSPWGSHAYQQKHPRTHGFDYEGRGTYEPE